MKSRSLIHLALAAALVPALVSGCGGKDDAPAGGAPGAAPASASSSKKPKIVPLAERPVAAPDPRDDAFRTWALTLGRQMADGMSGKPPEPSLLGPDASSDLRKPQHENHVGAIQRSKELLAVVVTMIGVRKGGTETCMFSVVAWGDERLAWSGGGVHWSAISVQPRQNETGAGPKLSTAAITAEWPALRGIWDRTLEARAAGQRLPTAPADVDKLLGGRDGADGAALQKGEAFDVVDRALADAEPWSFDLVEINAYLGNTQPTLERIRDTAVNLGVYARTAGDADVFVELPTVAIVR